MAGQEDGWGREISTAGAAYVKPEMKRKWVPFRNQKAGVGHGEARGGWDRVGLRKWLCTFPWSTGNWGYGWG